MVAKIKTFAFSGVEVAKVDVEVKITSGKHNFNIVGLPDKAVGESKERVWAAICSIGLSWPFNRIVVNLSPADLRKEGSHYDLAIALAIMIEMGVLKNKNFDDYYVLGELSLDGRLSPVNGIISAAIGANEKNKGLICPAANGKEAAWSGNQNIIAVNDIMSLINHIKGEQILEKPESSNISRKNKYPNLADVKGQDQIKRALEISAAGGHNLLMIGPPGTGKSMLAARLPGILPEMTLEEILEINRVRSAAGIFKNGELTCDRPFIEVHHSCSMPAMVGGGQKAKPGEISLSHRGVLFLDELAEFPRQVLDSLRQPIETGKISISRVNSHVTYPADFQLIAAMNPCKCGYLGDPKKECANSSRCGAQYKSKISGPLLDRFDIVVYVSALDVMKMRSMDKGEDSEIIRKRVDDARDIQRKRFGVNDSGLEITNSKISGDDINKYCDICDEDLDILAEFVKNNNVSMRGLSRIIRVARTIADMSKSDDIMRNHLMEAISYRRGI